MCVCSAGVCAGYRFPFSSEGVSAVPLLWQQTKYNLSADFHGSGWSSKIKGFCFPVRESC